jgi:hypothetical protein
VPESVRGDALVGINRQDINGDNVQMQDTADYGPSYFRAATPPTKHLPRQAGITISIKPAKPSGADRTSILMPTPDCNRCMAVV